MFDEQDHELSNLLIFTVLYESFTICLFLIPALVPAFFVDALHILYSQLIVRAP